jgi:hypothetical protein
MTEQSPKTDVRELPVIATILLGYREAVRYLPFYVAASIGWAAALGLVQLPLDHLLERRQEVGAAGTAALMQAQRYLTLAVGLFGAAVLSVMASRAVLLAQSPAWLDGLRIGRRQLRIVGLGLLFYVAIYVEVFAIFHVGFLALPEQAASAAREMLFGQDRRLGLYLLWILWSVLQSLTLTPFFGLAFPLASIDAGTSLLSRSARISSDYRWRIAAISIMGHLPFLLINAVPYVAWHGSSGTTVGVHVVASFVSLLGIAVSAATLAVTLDHVAGRLRQQMYDIFD